MRSTTHVHATFAVAALFFAIVLPGCTKPGGSMCPSGLLYCPAGSKCAAEQDICITTDCGDKTRQAGEECDDGNVKGGDGCSATCKAEQCGDGRPDEGEECDDGPNNSNTTGRCLLNCKWAACGDGQIREGEEDCDVDRESAELTTDCPYGPRSCKLCSFCKTVDGRPHYCGDGTVDDGVHGVEGNETCDDGQGKNGVTVCEYVTHPTGGTNTCKICNATCTELVDRTGPYCGDGAVDKAHGEACDDGAERNGKTYCADPTSSCRICKEDCSGTVEGHYCGDGQATDGEGCDDGKENGSTVCKYDTHPAGGTNTCKICDATCTAFVDHTGPYCGDGLKDGNETCDDGVDKNGTSYCPSVDGKRATASCLICNNDCTQYRQGGYCGDGTKGDDEQCDDAKSFTCGTCSADCRDMGVNQATGTLTVTSAVRDGDSFTLRDGTDSNTFEFDLSCGGANRCVARASSGSCSGNDGCVALEVGADGGTSDGGSVPECVASAGEGVRCTAAQVCVPVTADAACSTGFALVNASTSSTCAGNSRCVALAGGASGRTDGCSSSDSVCVEPTETEPLLESTVSSVNAAAIMSASLDAGTIQLENEAPGITGNIAIDVSSDGGITATGMDGGVGCPLGSSCARDEDCISPYRCRSNLCRNECDSRYDCGYYPLTMTHIPCKDHRCVP